MMSIHEELVDRVTAEFKLERGVVFNVVQMVEEGCSAAFIARYRKERTGGLDQRIIMDIEERYRDLAAVRSRKRTILKSIRKLGKLTPDLEKRIEESEDKAALEDIFLPYRAAKESIARAAELKGLRPYAERVLVFDPPADVDAIVAEAAAQLETVSTPEEARDGIRDILAELFAEDAEVRGQTRELARREGRIVSTAAPGKEGEPSRFQNFYNFAEPATEIPSHRLLAIRRGEKEGFLVMSLDFDRGKVVEIMRKRILLGGSETQNEFLNSVIDFAVDHLIKPAIAREVRGETKRRADMESIRVFIDNLRDMLLASPVGAVTVIGVDPGNRMGTRLAVVDGNGECIDSAAVFLNDAEQAKLDEAAAVLQGLMEKHAPRFVAVGNGSMSRQTEKALRSLLGKLPDAPEMVMINEAGISVYSSSDGARDELPNLDVATRAAVSMARRVQDPLRELIKIDPRSIGVGQYQHDVNQKLLREKLAREASACVNMVGCDVNSASPQLLSYISGLNPILADAVVDHRKRNGPFGTRASFTEVKGIGGRTFEQCAGFLFVTGGEIRLDATAIHPESYHIVEKIVQDAGKTLDEIMADSAALDGLDLDKYADEKAQRPTIDDIVAQLKKPGIDPRVPYQKVNFRPDVTDVKDLEPGMELEGRVSNVTRFGAFVDVGVHHDGLVHISEISERFVGDPSEVVRVGQVVRVRVLGVENKDGRPRVSLTMKLKDRQPPPQRARRPQQPRPPRRSKAEKSGKERLLTLDDLLNRFGDPRKPRIDTEKS